MLAKPDGRFGERRPAEIGVQHDAGRVDDAPQARLAAPRQAPPRLGQQRRRRPAPPRPSPRRSPSRSRPTTSRSASVTASRAYVRDQRLGLRRLQQALHLRQAPEQRRDLLLSALHRSSVCTLFVQRMPRACSHGRFRNQPHRARPWRRLRLQAVARRAARPARRACRRRKPSPTCWSAPRPATTPPSTG